MHLIIGGDSFVGKAVHKHLIELKKPVEVTSRRNMFFPEITPITADRTLPTILKKPYQLDLLDFKADSLPKANHVYLIAAITGFANCEGNPQAWRINVDAPIALARFYSRARIIFISSDCVEWSSAAYARQKAQTESYMQTIDGVIIRPARILPSTVDAFAKFVVDCALENRVGVNLWK